MKAVEAFFESVQAGLERNAPDQVEGSHYELYKAFGFVVVELLSLG